VFIFSSLDVTEQKAEVAGIFLTSEFFTPLLIINMEATAPGRFLLMLVACSVHVVTCSTTPGN
jgi:hypothetical protein